MAVDHPPWPYYPARSQPPAIDLVGAFASVKSEIDSHAVQGKQSDGILKELSPALLDLGYAVETSKSTPTRSRGPSSSAIKVGHWLGTTWTQSLSPRVCF